MSPPFALKKNLFQKSGQSSKRGRMPLKSLRASRAVLHFFVFVFVCNQTGKRWAVMKSLTLVSGEWFLSDWCGREKKNSFFFFFWFISISRSVLRQDRPLVADERLIASARFSYSCHPKLKIWIGCTLDRSSRHSIIHKHLNDEISFSFVKHGYNLIKQKQVTKCIRKT